MEDNIIEQPQTTSNVSSAQNDIQSDSGSIFGKFKDAKSLLEAYNHLEAEFTRKSQKLAEFTKEKEENAFFPSNETLDEFLKSTGNDEYKKTISEILLDSEINNLPNKYHIALKIAKEAERKSADNITSQDFVDKYILNNDQIRSQIITQYLSNINNISNLPKTISGNSSNIYFSPSLNKPKTLKEAGEVLSKMLK